MVTETQPLIDHDKLKFSETLPKPFSYQYQSAECKFGKCFQLLYLQCDKIRSGFSLIIRRSSWVAVLTLIQFKPKSLLIIVAFKCFINSSLLGAQFLFLFELPRRSNIHLYYIDYTHRKKFPFQLFRRKELIIKTAKFVTKVL